MRVYLSSVGKPEKIICANAWCLYYVRKYQTVSCSVLCRLLIRGSSIINLASMGRKPALTITSSVIGRVSSARLESCFDDWSCWEVVHSLWYTLMLDRTTKCGSTYDILILSPLHDLRTKTKIRPSGSVEVVVGVHDQHNAATSPLGNPTTSAQPMLYGWNMAWWSLQY